MKIDPTAAMTWFGKAADQEHREGICDLAYFYKYGKGGVAQDEPRAVAWFEQAAKMAGGVLRTSTRPTLCFGEPTPCVYVRIHPEVGHAGTSDIGSSACSQRPSCLGLANAQYNLGICLMFGEAGGSLRTSTRPKLNRRTESARLYEHSPITLKVPGINSCSDLGSSARACYQGPCREGVAQNAALAAEWWEKAAEYGHILAQTSIGQCYTNGNGVVRDHVKAVMYFRKSAASTGDSGGGRSYRQSGESQYHLGRRCKFKRAQTRADLSGLSALELKYEASCFQVLLPILTCASTPGQLLSTRRRGAAGRRHGGVVVGAGCRAGRCTRPSQNR